MNYRQRGFYGGVAFVLFVLVTASLLTACTNQVNANIVLAAPNNRVPGGDPRQGEQAIMQYGCGSCHTIAGVPGARGLVGPPLTGVGERAYIAGVLPNTPDDMVLWIMNPQAFVPGNAMPNLNVSEADARNIVAYLYSTRSGTFWGRQPAQVQR
ncbi:MAG: c-type cytochrome [Caldilineaceae bacterium]